MCCPEKFPEELYDVELPHGSLADSSKVLIVHMDFSNIYIL